MDPISVQSPVIPGAVKRTTTFNGSTLNITDPGSASEKLDEQVKGSVSPDGTNTRVTNTVDSLTYDVPTSAFIDSARAGTSTVFLNTGGNPINQQTSFSWGLSEQGPVSVLNPTTLEVVTSRSGHVSVLHEKSNVITNGTTGPNGSIATEFNRFNKNTGNYDNNTNDPPKPGEVLGYRETMNGQPVLVMQLIGQEGTPPKVFHMGSDGTLYSANGKAYTPTDADGDLLANVQAARSNFGKLYDQAENADGRNRYKFSDVVTVSPDKWSIVTTTPNAPKVEQYNEVKPLSIKESRSEVKARTVGVSPNFGIPDAPKAKKPLEEDLTPLGLTNPPPEAKITTPQTEATLN